MIKKSMQKWLETSVLLPLCCRNVGLIALITSGLLISHVAQAAMPADGQEIHILGVEKNEYLATHEGYLQSLRRGPESFIFIHKGGDKFSLQSLRGGTYVGKNGYWLNMVNNASSATVFTWIDLPDNQFRVLRNSQGIGVHSHHSRILAHTGTNSMLLAWSDASDYIEDWRVIADDPQFPTTDRILAFCSVTDAQYNLPADPANEDCTAAFQAALDAADADGGGTVFVPKGHYRLDGRLKIASNVTLRGRWRPLTASQPAAGTILKVYDGRGVEDPNVVRPFIEMGSGSGIMDLTFWHPNQDSANIVPYPPVLNASGTAQNLTFINAYQAIKMPVSTMCFIDNIEGTILKLGFYADYSKAVSRFDHINFGPEFWQWAQLDEAPLDPAYKSYMLANAIGIDLRDMDQFFMNNCKIRGMKLGMLFDKSPQNGAGPSGGFLSGFDIRDCVTAFDRRSGWAKVDNSYFHGTDRGTVGFGHFNTCTIKGGNVAVQNDKIALSAINTTFDGPLDVSQVDVSLINCDFVSSESDLILRSSVKSVTVVGCTFAEGAEMVDNAPDSIEKIIDPTRDENYLPAPPLPKRDWSIPRKPYSANVYNIEQYGAVANDEQDDTAALAAAVAAANNNGGGIVFIPNGMYNVSGSHTLVPGVEVRGVSGNVSSGGSHKPCSLLLISGNEGNPDGPAFLNLSTDCGVRGLTFHYSEQRSSMLRPGTIIHYPYTIRATGDNIYVTDIVMTNPYRGIHFYRADNHLIDRCKLGNLNNSVLIEESNNGRIGRFHLKPDFWLGMKLPGYPPPGSFNDLDLYAGKYLTCIWVKNSTNEVIHSIFNHTSHEYIRIDNTSALCHMTSCETIQGGIRFSGDQDIQVVFGGPCVNARGDDSMMWAYWADENFTATANIWHGYIAGTPGRLYLVESGEIVAQQVGVTGWSFKGSVNIEVHDGASLKLLQTREWRTMGTILEPNCSVDLYDVQFGKIPNTFLNHPGVSLKRTTYDTAYAITTSASGHILNDGLVLDPTDLEIVDTPILSMEFKNQFGAQTTNGQFKVDVTDPDFTNGLRNVEIRTYFWRNSTNTVEIYYDSTSGKKLGRSATYTEGSGFQSINFKVNDAQFDGIDDIEIVVTGESPRLNFVSIFRDAAPEPIRDPKIMFSEESSEFVLLEDYTDIYIEGVPADADETLSKVELYLDGQRVRTEGAAPYDWDETRDPVLQGLPAGTYELMLRAFDHEGNTSEAITMLTIIPIHDLTKSYDRIEAEDYDIGLAGTTYSDSTPGNAFGYYRNDDVDINRCNDIDGGFHVGNVGAGERLDYTIHVPLSGTYQIAFRYAAVGDRRCHAKIGTTNLTGAVTLSDTGSLGNWNTVSAQLDLPAGQQTLRVVLGVPTDVPMNLNWIQIRPTRTTGFQIWKQQHNMPDSAGTSGDRDGDGCSNEYEYLFGLNPTNPNSRRALSIDNEGTSPRFEYTARTDIPIKYTVMVSTNLVDWDVEEGVVEINTIDNGDGTSTRDIEFSLDPEVYDVGFVKIIAEE